MIPIPALGVMGEVGLHFLRATPTQGPGTIHPPHTGLLGQAVLRAGSAVVLGQPRIRLLLPADPRVA